MTTEAPFITGRKVFVAMALIITTPLGAQQFRTNGNTNLSSALNSVYVAGSNNTIGAGVSLSFLGGGSANRVATGSSWSFLGGGNGNILQSNSLYSFLGGGFSNAVGNGAFYGFVGGGTLNTVGTGAYAGAVVGGYGNVVLAPFSLIFGGYSNRIAATSRSSLIGGGNVNSIESGAEGSFIGAGANNTIAASAANAVILSGLQNRASASYATVLGGYSNSAAGYAATVLAGMRNSANGSFSIAAGFRANATHSGAMIFSDSAATNDFASTAANQFLIRATGGVGINTNDPGANALLVNGSARVATNLSIGGNLAVSGTITGTVSNLTASSLTTTNSTPIELKPGNTTGFSVTPQGTANLALTNPDVVTTYIGTGHNIIGGFNSHFVGSGVVGATIAGGGRLVVSNAVDGAYTNFNHVFDHFGTVSGGTGNSADGLMATVSGGSGNWAGGNWATIGGGLDNMIVDPTNIPSHALDISTIAGGFMNQILNAPGGTIGGGSANLITNTNVLTTENLQWPSTISGGSLNSSTNAGGSFIGGGSENTVNGEHGVVAGGANNIAGEKATVPGGMSNEATGIGSFAAGVRAKATNDYSFVWGGDPNNDTVSTADSSFTVNAPGGSTFVTGTSGSQPVGVTLAANATAWDTLSDSNAKTAVTSVDHRETLRKIAALPVASWRYKHDPQRRYIGPMAQDFHATFGLGADDKHISTLDTDGVTLSAIKGLVAEIQEQDAVLAEREAQIRNLETQVKQLRNQAGL